MNDLKSISAKVKMILEEEPATRNSDELLYVKVCQQYNPSISVFPFGTVLPNYRTYGLPSMKSVERARRKVQEKNEHLKACKIVKECRAENELKYKSFALDMQYE